MALPTLAVEPIQKVSAVRCPTSRNTDRGSFDITLQTKAEAPSSSPTAERFPSQRVVHRVGTGNHGTCADKDQPRLCRRSRACHLRPTLRLSLAVDGSAHRKFDQDATMLSDAAKHNDVWSKTLGHRAKAPIFRKCISDLRFPPMASTTRADTQLRAQTWLTKL